MVRRIEDTRQLELFGQKDHVKSITSSLQSDWRPPELSSLPDWGSAKRIGIDVETRDDHLKDLGIGVRRGGYIVGISVTIEDGPSFYLPYRHEGGDNLDEQQVLAYMRDNARRFKGIYVGANLPYDIDYLWEEGIVSTGAKYYDVQVADPLLYELHMSYSLKAVAERHGLPGKDEAALTHAAKVFGVNPKSGMWKLPARYVGAYAERDTQLPLQIMRKQERLIHSDEYNLGEVWELESKVLPVLVKMRRRGVRIDQDKLAEVERWSLQEEALALEEVFRLTGSRIAVGDVHRADAFVPALKSIGLEPNVKTKYLKPRKGEAEGRTTEQFLVDAALLKSQNHPVTKQLLRARKVNKLRTTFAESIRSYMTNGRIHCTFNQVVRQADFGKADDTEGGRFGRLSCKDPNLQQQPSRDEFAKMWRSIYVPEEGAIWGCLDYSQQEPRWTTHWATVLKLEKAAEAAEEYWTNPKADNHDMMAKLTGLARKAAKTIYLGLCYGQGGRKLCEDLGLPTGYALGWEDKDTGKFTITYYNDKDEADLARLHLPAKEAPRGWACAGEEGRQILDTFNGKAPFIKELSKIASKKAGKFGVIKSISGRRMNFPPMSGDSGSYGKKEKFDWTHKALNRLIQGSAADQTKTAMVLIDEMPDEVYLQLQVHDEMDGSFGTVSEMKKVAKVMEEAIPDLKVPFRVDVEAGPSWGEAVEV